MKGVVFLGERKLELREFPDPEPGPGQVVVRMRASGLCGSDLTVYRASAGDMIGGTGVIRGHEPCGVVAAVGPGGRSRRVGEWVMVHHYSGCGACGHCLTGWTQLCAADGRVYGGHVHGGDADYLLVEDYMCVPMPDGLSFEAGAMCACGTGTAYQALKRLDVSGRDTLAVFGQGPVGLSATFLGAAMGARVIAVDPVEERRALAQRHGAWKTVDPAEAESVEAIRELTHGALADASLDATGIGAVRAAAVRSTRVWGRACLVGEGGAVTFEPTPDIIHRQLTLIGSWTFSTVVLDELARFVAERDLPLDDLITHRFPLDRAAEAFRLFDGRTTGKVVLTWD